MNFATHIKRGISQFVSSTPTLGGKTTTLLVPIGAASVHTSPQTSQMGSAIAGRLQRLRHFKDHSKYAAHVRFWLFLLLITFPFIGLMPLSSTRLFLPFFLIFFLLMPTLVWLTKDVKPPKGTSLLRHTSSIVSQDLHSVMTAFVTKKKLLSLLHTLPPTAVRRKLNPL